jgi:hypothetical protein
VSTPDDIIKLPDDIIALQREWEQRRTHGTATGVRPDSQTNGQRRGGDTWRPVDLADLVDGSYAQEQPALLARSDNVHLFYRERVHSLTGEPETGKSWLALLATAERLAASEHVLYVDFETSAPEVVDRLLELGADSESILQNFRYVRPDEPLQSLEPLLGPPPALAVLDGVTEALTVHGLDLRDNTDIAKWLALLPRPLQRAGAAVVQLDHVTKSRDDRGRWAIGAQHKLAGVDVAYSLDTVEPFGRGRAGHSRVLVHKDRPGYVRQHARGKVVADLHMATDDGVRLSLVAPEDRQAFRPTGYMEKVSRACEDNPGLSKRALRTVVGGKTGYADLAIELLLSEGYLEVRCDGQARCHYAIRPFRDAESNPDHDPRDPTVTHRDPQTRVTVANDRDPVTPPIRGHGHGHAETTYSASNCDPSKARVESNDPPQLVPDNGARRCEACGTTNDDAKPTTEGTLCRPCAAKWVTP